MSAARQLPRIAKCFNCQRRIVNALLDLSGLTIRPRVISPIRRQSVQPIRLYSEGQRSDIVRPVELQTSEVEGVVNYERNNEFTAELEDVVEESATPWYLQEEEEPQLIPRSMLERQKLPELPLESPECLQAMIEHLSTQIGLDYLTLHDLRKLDPPPAFGAGLIMVFGTARSEKHLHVSADRFCRWLRSTYKLNPRADGLLGRNEIKLKLRRRAKRAKLLRSVGSEPSPHRDDGLSTGWICVNAGIVEHGSSEEKSLDEEGIIGFGGRDDNVRLVVQMLTEDKRQDLDLETLWDGAIKRQERKDQREDADIEGGDAENVPSTAPLLDQVPRPLAIGQIQQRRFHSNARRFNPVPTSDVMADVASTEAGHHPPLASLEEEYVSTSSARAEELLASLRTLTGDEVRASLGRDAEDRSSHQFLMDFYASLPPLSEPNHWAYRLELLEEALYNAHPGYTERDVFDTFNEMQDSLIITPPPFFEAVIDIIVKPVMELEVPNGPRFLNNFNLVLDVLDSMHVRAIPISQSVSENILTSAILAKSFDESSSLLPDTIHGVMHALATSKAHLTSPHAHKRILALLARVGNWPEYWRYYRTIALYMQRRPQMLYAAMFQQVAATNDRLACAEALSELLSTMEIESPPVKLTGELARSVLDCLAIADPHSQALGQSTSYRGKRPWVQLWRACEASLKDPEEMVEPEDASEIGIFSRALETSTVANASRYRKVLISLRDP